MRIDRRRLRAGPVGIIVGFLIVSGCTAPTAVNKYARVSKTAGEQFAKIEKDLYRSCVRQQFYHGLSVSDPDLDTLETAALGACGDYKKAAKGLRKANRVLIGYLKALSKLADKKTVVYNDDVDDLADSIEDTYPFDKRRVAAVEGVSSFLVEAAAGGWRRSELGKAIERTNDDVQVLTAMFRGIVEDDYTRLLDGEREAARKYFLGKVKTGGDEEPVAAVLVYDLWQKEQAALDAKEDAARAYGKILRKIARGHQKLYDNRNDLDSKEMRKFVLEYTETLEELILDVMSVF
jgi:hypothetical protein